MEETRCYVRGIPFMMNEAWLRNVLTCEDIQQPWKVVILRKGHHRHPQQWANCFLFYSSRTQAENVAAALNGFRIRGWHRPLQAKLAMTDPWFAWQWFLGCILKSSLLHNIWNLLGCEYWSLGSFSCSCNTKLLTMYWGTGLALVL